MLIIIMVIIIIIIIIIVIIIIISRLNYGRHVFTWEGRVVVVPSFEVLRFDALAKFLGTSGVAVEVVVVVVVVIVVVVLQFPVLFSNREIPPNSSGAVPRAGVQGAGHAQAITNYLGVHIHLSLSPHIYIYVYVYTYIYIYIYIYLSPVLFWKQFHGARKHGGPIKVLLQRSFFPTKPLFLGIGASRIVPKTPA